MIFEILVAILVGAVLIAAAVYFGLRARGDGAPQADLATELARVLNGELPRLLSPELERVRNALLEAQSGQRKELSAALSQSQQAITGSLVQQIGQLTESNAQRLMELRGTVDARLKDLQADNTAKLEEMRKTVDEKLQATLEQRLGQSFKQVSERLEQVHKGLGEMQALAAGVGDLKRVLTNVKTRGTWGEMQLGNLLEQLLAPGQYETNVATRPDSKERVEFAIRLPGRDADSPVWLPIDAKFPQEDYERLVRAQELADAEGVELAGRELEKQIRFEAQKIRDKYVQPPHTTDFAILFLPTESLFAELIRRPGLCDALQRDFRVSLMGPTTLAAHLNALQMGFRTLAIEQRSSEVWQVLGAVKTEFGKFGDVLKKVKTQLSSAVNTIDDAETRTRQMSKKLKNVEALPQAEAQAMLPELEQDSDDA